MSKKITSSKAIKLPIKNKNDRFLELAEIIPNWETHLTEKQLEVAKEFIICLNVSEVDHQLNLKVGTARNRIFGNSSTSKGAIGTLENVFLKLTDSGYFEKLQKRKFIQTVKPVKSIEITNDMLNKTKELFRLVVEIPNYKKYLNKTQNKFILEFMRLRSYATTAKHFGIKESILINHLLDEHTGVLAKLREVANTTMVNTWDEVN